MRTENTSIVIDTYAWIEYFRGSDKGKVVKEYLLGSMETYTPSIVLAELARKYFQENMPESTVRERLSVVAETTTIVGIDEELALEAGKIYMELVKHAEKQGLKQKPSLNDAIILATARKLRARVITGDKHFKNLEDTVWIGMP